jgi:pimeloyl-ACP methyl ester carboxylesterase
MSEAPPGTLERIEPLKRYSAWRLRLMIRLARLPAALPVHHGVELFRLTYWTELLGRPTIASALLAVPRGRTPRGAVMWFNGTNATRSEAPSGGGVVGLLVAAAFAGSGHIVLAPDYIGLGESKTFHPYLHTGSTVSAALDLLTAARRACDASGVQWQSSIALVGYSQGGFSTAVVQRALEASADPPVAVRAAAAIAPPLDLAEVSIPWGLTGEAPSHSTYLAYLAQSYAHVYGHRLEDIFLDEYAAAVPTLFDGEHTAEQITGALPRQPAEMLQPGFVDGYRAGEPSWLRSAALENEAFDWAPKAPLRLYYGDADVDVHPDDARRAAAHMAGLGGNVELVSVGPHDHGSVVYHAVPMVQRWLSHAL